jgi:hypothetical protein
MVERGEIGNRCSSETQPSLVMLAYSTPTTRSSRNTGTAMKVVKRLPSGERTRSDTATSSPRSARSRVATSSGMSGSTPRCARTIGVPSGSSSPIACQVVFDASNRCMRPCAR